MSRFLHPGSAAKCLLLLALFVGLYHYSKPPAAPAEPNALGKVMEAGDVPAACFLLRVGGDLGQNEVCHTPLHKAAVLGNLSTVKSLLTDGAAVAAVDSAGQTPLFAAAALGHDQIAEALLAQGASVRIADRSGRTPLHWAVASGDEEMAALLIDYGADPDAHDAQGVTPRSLAQSDFPLIAKLFDRIKPVATHF